jgi:AraC-like DNA-binding protein
VEYREYLPSALLAGVVRCIWTLEGQCHDLAATAQPILPDGRAEIVLHLGAPFDVLHDDGRIERQPRLIFAGQLTSPLVLRPSGAISVVGIRFRADGAPAFIDIPQHRLAGHTLDLRELSRPLADRLLDACAGQPTLAHAVRSVASCLERVLDDSRIDRHVRASVNAICRQRGIASVRDAAALTGISRRHLERRFQDVVGLSPKRFARITRFQHALQIFERGTSGRRGAVTAAACGYADQAHFIREFGELAGCSPEAHLLRDAMLARLFSESALLRS